MASPRAGIVALLLTACHDGAASGTSSTATGDATATTSTSGTTGTTGALTTGAPLTTSTTDPGTTTTTGRTTTGTTGDDTTTGALTRCPTVAAPAQAAVVSHPAITEASGLVASRTQPGVFWLHNDSGDDPRFFGLDAGGGLLGVFHVVGAAADDWEDMSSGPGPSPGEWLYFGDIGDNPETRPTITVYRVPEPDAAAAGGGAVDVAGVEAIELVYPDAPHNAETLLVDPQTGDLVIVAKGDPTRIFALAGPVAAGGPYTLDEVAPIDFPATVATGGDVSPLGDFVAVRTYAQAFLWLRAPGTTLADAFAGPPCAIPLAVEPQGETLAVASDGAGYYTLSEGEDRPLYTFAFQR